jgi:hypothetical protein
MTAGATTEEIQYDVLVPTRGILQSGQYAYREEDQE